VLLPSRIPAKITPRVDLDPEGLRKFIVENGLRATWEQAADCPCVRRTQEVVLGFGYPTLTSDQTTSDARADCTVCGGKGYYHHSSQPIVALFVSAHTEPERFAPWGEYARGMVSITTLPEHIPGLFDRFTLTDSVLVFRESRRRTSATVESMRYPIVTRTLDLSTGPTAVAVFAAQRTDAAGVTTPADSMAVGVDFVVVGGQIDWTLGDALGSAPVEGAWYAISYYARPRFVAVDYPHSFRDTWVRRKTAEPTFAPLPTSSMARLEFYGTGQ